MTAEERIRELEEENQKLRLLLDQRERFIYGTVSRYLTDEVLEELMADPLDFRIGGERRVVSIMFTDLRHSTELSEQMSPVDFLRMLNHYFGEMIEIVNAWQGNILEFVGDAIVAVFGAPRENEFAARDAAACAVAMQRRMGAVNEWNRAHAYPEIAMGIGLHTGEAILGSIGSQTRAKYDMIGRNVNLAARIEGFTQGGQILASTELLEAAGPQVKTDRAGEMWVRPKGIQTDILLHSVVGFGKQTIRGET